MFAWFRVDTCFLLTNFSRPAVYRLLLGALSRYSVIFCTILLWGKIMAAVHFAKRHVRATTWVPCMPLIQVYFVLCSKVYTTAPEKFRSSEEDSSLIWDRSTELWNPVLNFRHFLPSFKSATTRQQRLFVRTFLISSQSPDSCEKSCTDSWRILWIRHRLPSSKLSWRKKVRPATPWPAPWPQVSSSPFLSTKNRHKNTE